MGLKAINWYEGADNGTPFSSYKVVKKKSLNFFDIGANSNKYYTIELHEGSGAEPRLFTDYGRLGVTSTKQVRYGSKWEIESEFEKILREKLKKGYEEVELAQSSTGSSEARKLIDANEIKIASSVPEIQQSNLDPGVRKFVQHIFDESGSALSSFISGNTVLDKKAPLGKLSVKQINLGRDILQDIAHCITATHASCATGPMGAAPVVTHQPGWVKDPAKVEKLSSDYRRAIPRVFGHRIDLREALIDSNEKISVELDLLKFYEDSLRMEDIIVSDDIDKRYEGLHSDLWVINRGSPEWQHLEDYVINSQSQHHGWNLKVESILGVTQRNAPYFQKELGNVKELFHGSRTANLPGILSTYLKLPTQLSGVFITGAMFGPGIYFADQSTKSTQYATSRFGGRQNHHDTAFLFVADVACGRIKEENNSNYYLKPPDGYHSVKGVAGQRLLHNEYIVYNSSQQALKYIIEFSQSYK